MIKVKIVLIVITFMLLLSCSSKKYEGSKNPEWANQGCPLKQGRCNFRSNIDNRVVDGYYVLEKIDLGKYRLKGAVRLDLSKASPTIRTISSMSLTFVFLDNTTVVRESKISVNGKVNTLLEFSELIETDSKISSSNIASVGWRSSELGSY